MNYFDPARPKLANGNLMYCDAQGNGIAALPDLIIRLEPGQKSDACYVSVWLMVARATAREFRTLVALSSLLELSKQYNDDPEAFLKLRFGYSGPEAEAPDASASASTSAEELGL